MPSRPVPDEHDVIVRVDEAGECCSAFEVDPPDVSPRHANAVAYRRKPAVLDQHLRDDPIIRVHRMDLAVHQEKVLPRRLLLSE
jgi:hypothetical protein